MEKKRIILVGLDASPQRIDFLLEAPGVTLQVAPDVDSGLETARTSGCDLLVVNRDMSGLDPVDVVAMAHNRLGNNYLPFVFIAPDKPDESLVVRRSRSGEFLVDRPDHSQLKEVVAQALRGEEPQSSPEERTIESQISDIGFEDHIEVDGRSLLIQTEVHAHADRATVRCMVYENGQILTAKSTPHEYSSDPVGETLELAKSLHQKTLDSVKSS